jgi:hypothetical protein
MFSELPSSGTERPLLGDIWTLKEEYDPHAGSYGRDARRSRLSRHTRTPT